MTLKELGNELEKFMNFKYIAIDQHSVKLYDSEPIFNSSYRVWEGRSVGYLDKFNFKEDLDLSKFKKKVTPTGKIIPDYSKALEKL